LRGADSGKLGLSGLGEYGVFTRQVGLWAADKALRAAFQTFAHAGGFYGYHLPDMDAVADVARDYYHNDLRGGEGHMEVGKLILNVVKNKASMTLSVKPFGCMPSSGVSDGVQSLITEKFPGTIFCAVETSGDGAVNFQSRVQMYLFKAKQATAAEIDKALAESGLTMDQVRAFVTKTTRLRSALHHPPHSAGCTTADLVYEAAELMRRSPLERWLGRGKKIARASATLLEEAIKNAPAHARRTVALCRTGAGELAEVVREQAPVIAESAARAAKARMARVVPFAPDRKANQANFAVAAG
jgi:hypothetical protein